MTNALDKFLPFFVERVGYARRNGITRFQIWHPTGDRILVVLTNGSVRAMRYTKIRDPETEIESELHLVTLQTTEDQLRRDLVTGITSKQAELFRG